MGLMARLGGHTNRKVPIALFDGKDPIVLSGGASSIFLVDDVLTIDESVATDWRFPTNDGPEGYTNDPACYIDGSRCYLRGDIIRVGDMPSLGINAFGTIADELIPSIGNNKALRQYANNGIDITGSTFVGDTGQWQFGPQFSSALPITDDSDGIIYLTLEVEFLLADPAAARAFVESL